MVKTKILSVLLSAAVLLTAVSFGPIQAEAAVDPAQVAQVQQQVNASLNNLVAAQQLYEQSVLTGDPAVITAAQNNVAAAQQQLAQAQAAQNTLAQQLQNEAAAAQQAAAAAQLAAQQQAAQAQLAAQQQAAQAQLAAQQQTPSLIPAGGLAEAAKKRGVDKKYAGLTYSVLGDSISTFAGTMPEGYLNFYPAGGVASAGMTWWGLAGDALGMHLLRNCSWSGSRMSGATNDASGKTGGSDKRISDLFARVDGIPVPPHVLFIMLGTNDFLSDVPVSTFQSAYISCLTRIKARMPGTIIICLTCPPCTSMVTSTKLWNSNHDTIEAYNDAIRTAAVACGVTCLDTWNCGMNQNNAKEYTCGEGVHPNAAGMMLIANVIVNTIP